MPYPEQLVTPMRQELVELGFEELKTSDDVDKFLAHKDGADILVFNSICGCAAGGARPGIAMSLEHSIKPDRMATVFAGQDTEATEKLRQAFPELPPSSPSIIVTKDGALLEYIPRHRIEGRHPQEIAQDLVAVYDRLQAEAAE